MRDWNAHVRKRLASLREIQRDREQIADELAAHLEEHYESLLSDGVAEEEAFARTCARTGNWQELSRRILSAKQEGTMTDRIRQIWVPGLVTLLTSYIVLAALQWWGTRPFVMYGGEPRGIVFYVPWLLLLPFIGAVGGYLSRRANAAGWRVYLAASLPALALGAFFLLFFPLVFFIDRPVSLQIKGTALTAGIAGWVILPGIALCVGVALQGVHKSRTAIRP
jgi:hypothetical protein